MFTGSQLDIPDNLLHFQVSQLLVPVSQSPFQASHLHFQDSLLLIPDSQLLFPASQLLSPDYRPSFYNNLQFFPDNLKVFSPKLISNCEFVKSYSAMYNSNF